jgi:hypothetical protein
MKNIHGIARPGAPSRGPALALLAAACACFLAVACQSAPKSSSEPVAPPPKAASVEPAKPSAKPSEVAAPDELRAKAVELRKKAFDLGLKDVLPDDYAAAEKSFADGNAKYGSDNAASAAAFSDAVAKYRTLVDKGLPLLAASERKRASRLRDEAGAKQGGELFPSLYEHAEEAWAETQKAESSGSFEAAIAGYRASAKDYEVLYKLCDAKAARDYISSRDLEKWAPSPWSLAEAKYQSAQDLMKEDAKAAAAAVDEALLRYGNARDTALEYYAGDRKKASDTERDRAMGIKTEVAVKDEYAAASELYAKAEKGRSDKDFETSASLYGDAAKAYGNAYVHAKAKMDTAKDELESLDEALATKEAAGKGR